jgi:hypothetical protein
MVIWEIILCYILGGKLFKTSPDIRSYKYTYLISYLTVNGILIPAIIMSHNT